VCSTVDRRPSTVDNDGDTGTYRQYSKTLRDVMDRVKGAEEEEEEEEGWDVFFFGRSDEASVWKPPRSVGVGRCPVVPVEVAMSSSWIPRGSFTE